MPKTLSEFLSRQKERETGLFAIESIPNRDTMVRVFFYFGGEGVLVDTYVDIPRDAIQSVEATDMRANFRGRMYSLVYLTFEEGDAGSIHLADIFAQMRRNVVAEDVEAQVREPMQVAPRGRRAAAVDEVAPRLRGATAAAPDTSPFNRPIS